jgi:hypothetical protein
MLQRLLDGRLRAIYAESRLLAKCAANDQLLSEARKKLIRREKCCVEGTIAPQHAKTLRFSLCRLHKMVFNRA